MEDLRQRESKGKKGVSSAGSFNYRRTWLGVLLTYIYNLIRNKWKGIVISLFIILLANVIFNPINSAEFISKWYNDFIITIVEDTK